MRLKVYVSFKLNNSKQSEALWQGSNELTAEKLEPYVEHIYWFSPVIMTNLPQMSLGITLRSLSAGLTLITIQTEMGTSCVLLFGCPTLTPAEGDAGVLSVFVKANTANLQQLCNYHTFKRKIQIISVWSRILEIWQFYAESSKVAWRGNLTRSQRQHQMRYPSCI